MDLAEFKAGLPMNQPTGYKSFIPELVNQSYNWQDPAINKALEDANLKLGALNSFSQFVPNIELFIRMHVVKEATESSRIEGTNTNIEEAVQGATDILPEKRDDWQEVDNYIQAMNYAIDRLESLPLSSRLLKETHKILLENVRGEQKLPGEFRRSQNWIGGSSIRDAIFVPPPHDEVDRLMSDLESFIHNEEISVPHLVKIAIAHYQFETIHPFLDGNGRIGRLMITIYLINNKIIGKPILYLSDFFEKHKGLYYDNLMAVRRSNGLIQWIRFFLEAVSKTCEKATNCLQRIMELRRDCEKRISAFGRRAPTAHILLDYLFQQPVLDASVVIKKLNVSSVTTYKIIEDFLRAGILRETTGYKRNRVFVFGEYLDLFK